MSVAQLKTINWPKWKDYMLSKVVDVERRDILTKLFLGDEGTETFYKMMTSRRGAIEFKNGTWKPEINTNYRNPKKFVRPCIGCGHPFLMLAPWGEIIKDLPHICPTCENIITKNKTINYMATTKDTVAEIKDLQEKLKQKHSSLIDGLSEQLAEVNTTVGILIGEGIAYPIIKILELPVVKQFLAHVQSSPAPVKRAYNKKVKTPAAAKTPKTTKVKGTRKPMSAEHKAKIAAAAKKRWAAKKKK